MIKNQGKSSKAKRADRAKRKLGEEVLKNFNQKRAAEGRRKKLKKAKLPKETRAMVRNFPFLDAGP